MFSSVNFLQSQSLPLFFHSATLQTFEIALLARYSAQSIPWHTYTCSMHSLLLTHVHVSEKFIS